MDKFFLKDSGDTYLLGDAIAEHIDSNTLIALRGELGAGKTSLTKAIVKSLGIDETVTSPTFNLMNIYQGKKKDVYHFDFYRLEDIGELFNIGFYEYTKKGISIIEWADKFEDALPISYIYISLTYDEKGESRYFTIQSVGKKYQDTVQNIIKSYQKRKGETK